MRRRAKRGRARGGQDRIPGSAARLAAMVAAAYAASSWVAFILFNASEAGAVFFPPAGVTLAALMLTSYRMWPWVLAAAGTAELTVDLVQGHDIGYAWGFVLANLVEPLVGATLVRRAVQDLDLSRRRDLAAFLAFGVIVGPLFGGAIGATTMSLGMGTPWVDSFGPFWAGDALGALTLGGAIVAWRRSPVRWTARASVHAVAWLVATAAVTAIGFWPREIPLAYLVIPLLFWFAARYGIAMVAAGGTVVAVTANAMTAAGRGPWHALADVSPAGYGHLAGVHRRGGAQRLDTGGRDRRPPTGAHRPGGGDHRPEPNAGPAKCHGSAGHGGHLRGHCPRHRAPRHPTGRRPWWRHTAGRGREGASQLDDQP